MIIHRLITVIVLITTILFVSCNGNSEKLESSKDKSTTLQTGDLVFVALPLDYMADTTEMGSAIAASTGDSVGINYIHVAIAEVANDSVWIIDATLAHGVDRHPLDTFFCDFTLDDGSLPQMDIMRLSDNSNAAKYVENAKQFTGRGYDLYFLPDNDEQYCSELVRNSYIDEKGEYLFSDAPMNFKSDDGTFPPYWVWLFEQIGQPIPQGLPGTNPNAMSKEKCLKKVDIDIKKYSTAK
ncbi:MAG: hypothetical protein J6S84_10690 [Bacteroidales bacterium]|nr:hypothetical protein [Bacteroidales bacterium]